MEERSNELGTIMEANPKLTGAHTVESLLESVKRVWMTLTANKHGLKGVLKEAKALSWGYYVAGVGVHEHEETQGGGKAIEDEEGNVIEILHFQYMRERNG